MNPNTLHGDDHNGDYAIYLRQTLGELQDRVEEHEAALSKLRATPAVNRNTRDLPATASLEIMKAAYDDVASQNPFLPLPDSILPALIALRKTHQTVEETRTYLATHSDAVQETQRRLEAERARLQDQQALSQSMRNRIQSLQDGLENRMEMGPEDIARERIDELRQKKKTYARDTSKLLKSLRKFIDEHLAAMLAAEDLGGPVVGDLMDIDGEDLAAGFSAQGRRKKPSEKADDGKRQQRIDEIWGIQGQEGQPVRNANDSRDETAAAGAEMRELTEELLNSLAESDGDHSAAYVALPRETAAARFLVRSKVAQFHPRDSTRLRPVDFGRELDD
ncbi:Uu.00g039650.m01.CDS01 [Anthostomella pinea]|uniref:Uu.00g039650.m01.CDS01 n=1 Tax=Anthostomella pinea TaxID=933095 RepID=A0AAI8VAJ2_9PEZI|nr:Uu.00g039650.m01.CDS01 [Anthostomella pinea]